MDSDEDEEKETSKVPKLPIQMFISEANKYRKLLKYDKAIDFFNTALEREPNNEKSLIGRSRCNMRLTKYSEAKEDAEAALRSNPKSIEAKLLIGEADYFLGDFEKAFLTFYRTHTVRQNSEELKFGHQMCRRAIDNALEPDKPMVIDDKDIAKLPELGKDSGQPVEMRTVKDILTPDVEFVETLLEDDVIQSVHPDCEYILKYLKDRQQFWRTQNPNTSKRNTETTDSEIKMRKADDTREPEIIKEQPKNNIEPKTVQQDTTNVASTSKE